MNNTIVKLKPTTEFDFNLGLPQYQTLGAAGADLKACFKDRGNIIIGAGQRLLIPTGLKIELPVGYEAQIRPRSGISIKTPLMVILGTIDSDYRGEIKIILVNYSSQEAITVNHGERLAQIVIAPCTQAKFEVQQNLSKSKRGELGFGSTGINNTVKK